MGVVAGAGNYVLFVWRTFASLRFTLPVFTDVLTDTLAALRLAWRPAVFVSVPFGMAFAFNFDSLLGIIGARPFAGGSIAPSTILLQGPMLAGLVTAAVVGAAFCADIGARKVRDEIASMEVMGVNPLPRLVIPRVIATTITVPVMFALGSASFLLGGYILLIVFRDMNPGTFINGMQTLLTVSDVLYSLAKSAIYGTLIGLTACYYGFQAEGGPSGVASKVRASIITSLILVWMVQLFFSLWLSGGI